MFVQREANKKGCDQVLWLYGPDHQLTEVGNMNIFIFWTREDGGEPCSWPSPSPGGSGHQPTPLLSTRQELGPGGS